MPEIIKKNTSRYTQKDTDKSFVLFAVVANLLLPFLNTIYRSVPRRKEQDKVHRFTYRDPVAPSFPMTNLPPTRQRTNDLMLLFAEGTRRASGRWSATKLSNKIRPRRSHGRGGRPSPLHTFACSPVPAPPGRACSFAYVAGTRRPVRLPLARPGGSSQSQPAPISGKLLPIYLASRETIFPRKSAVPLASFHQRGGK